MPELIPVGKRIRDILRERGIPQIRFEEETGVSKRVLYGDHWIRRSTLMALAYYFGVSVEELVDGTTGKEMWEEPWKRPSRSQNSIEKGSVRK
ncbi:MAG: helix-turn-helix domain-containing protein [Dysosmobacter sp.]|nr:helix-turn-helix domain-containing protein [Dysosmobacter sp.]